ncbi:MAG: hypothetical protein Kow0037_07020 [Calditrichia bacterium]
MQPRENNNAIKQFIRKITIFWQINFLVGVLLYGVSFLHKLQFNPSPKILTYFAPLDLTIFAIAVILAVIIFRMKRKLFSQRSLRLKLEELYQKNPDLDEAGLLRLLLDDTAPQMKRVWIMGTAIILVGVVLYWWTFLSRNMHIYFIVGLYSLMMNYPRKDLFLELPYLVHETIRDFGLKTGEENSAEEL